ncbi:hypothetical protein [Plantactinospora sp. GCM10030261]|uniref:hypothetical protein n=1 Tax=Plantactinospora sp. GCM10030261 TaxID=3273420 RepID=UPI00360F6AD2
MRLFRRTPKLPADRRPPLDPEERVLAWAVVDRQAGTVVATNRGLWLPEPVGPSTEPVGPSTVSEPVKLSTVSAPGGPEATAGPVAGSRRCGWHEVHKAVWSGRELTVTPAERIAERDGYQVVADLPARTFLLLEPGELPEQVRARVTKSVAYTAHHRLDGGGVRVVARRVSGVDGLTWTVRYDPGTPPDDPSVIATTDALIVAARAELPTAPSSS